MGAVAATRQGPGARSECGTGGTGRVHNLGTHEHQIIRVITE